MTNGAQSAIEETAIRSKLCIGCTACVDLGGNAAHAAVTSP
jgi:hypothetical protein